MIGLAFLQCGHSVRIQALGHDAEQGRVDQIGRYAEIEHAG